jgi:hypothetical protein
MSFLWLRVALSPLSSSLIQTEHGVKKKVGGGGKKDQNENYTPKVSKYM